MHREVTTNFYSLRYCIFQARLGGAEGRVRALEAQLIQVENAKKETEQKLCSIGSTLRRIAGIQIDGSVHQQAKHTRRWSPVRGKSPSLVFLKENGTILLFLNDLQTHFFLYLM